MSMEERRKELNPRMKALRRAISAGERHQAVDCFLTLHGMLHSQQVAPQVPWSYEDDLLDELEARMFRVIPEKEVHSLAWIIWHLSRIEDVTMNLLVAGGNQVFETGNWIEKINSPIRHTGNGTGEPETRALSEAVDIPALRAYRHAVGRATREIVQSLTIEDFSRKVEPAALQRVVDEGAVIDLGYGVVDYWSRRDVAGLLLMPPTRHTILHWNEARRIINRLAQ